MIELKLTAEEFPNLRRQTGTSG